MGNETSSLNNYKIHSLLTADDLKRLRAGFPEGAVGAKPPSDLEWGAWKDAWPQEIRQKWSDALSCSGQTGQPEISFSRYQEMAGNVVRGTTEERIKMLFMLIHEQPLPEAKQPYEGRVKASKLVLFVEDVVRAASRLTTLSELTDKDSESAATLAKSLIKDLAFPDVPAKKCLYAVPEDDVDLDFDAVERWTAIKCPLFDQIFRYALASSFGLQIVDDTVPLRGNLKLTQPRNTSLSPADVFFLNGALPGREAKQCWRQLFNSATDGQSFSKLQVSLLCKAARSPTLLILRERDTGHTFGGFASEPWTVGPKFHGGNGSFLFHLHPRHYVYESTPYNSNYQYLNVNAKTFPNGLGMGGQIDFFGLWIDSEYGKARCAPSCSSFASPQLSKEEYFHFDHLEVWAIGDLPEEDSDDEQGPSALDRDPEAVAVMEMMGKTFISKDVKAADENIEKSSGNS